MCRAKKWDACHKAARQLPTQSYTQYALNIDVLNSTVSPIDFANVPNASIGIYDANEFSLAGPMGTQPILDIPINAFGTISSPTFRSRGGNVVVLVHIMGDKTQQANAGVFYLDNLTLNLVENSVTYTCDASTPNTQISTSTYRYGFNGQERDYDINPAGNINTAMFWEYDARLGRRWNVDPKNFKYPDESPYLVFHNNPLLFSDPYGDDPPTLNDIWSIGSKSNTFLKIAKAANIKVSDFETAKIQMGGESSTNPSNGNILINKFDNAYAGVTSMTHEMTNRKNLGMLAYTQALVRIGEISDVEYANKIIAIESEGTINQIFVVSELIGEDAKVEDVMSQYDMSTIMAGMAIALKNKKLSKKDISEYVISEAENAILKDTGEKAKDRYKRQGREIRQAEQKREGKMKKEEIQIKNKRIKATAKKIAPN
ncbi:MAG TPA: hypothetical protein PKO18_01085 [Chitinophagales bacterium]|nr:hypothetical protein [Chitinophagales bacterium]